MQSQSRLIFECSAAFLITHATDTTGADDVQRQLQLRELQQLELRLKMQQQLDRAAHPPRTPGADLRQRQVERDQQQRLQQLQDQDVRRTIPPAPPGAAEARAKPEIGAR